MLPILMIVSALAQSEPASDGPPGEAPADDAGSAEDPSAAAPDLGDDEKIRHWLLARYGQAWLPEGLLDAFTFDAQGGAPPRGRASTHVIGLELDFVMGEHARHGVYVELLPFRLEEGYWDDREDPPDYDEGTYIQPEGLVAFAVGGTFGTERVLLDTETVDVGVYFGGGLGVAVVAGKLNQWEGDATSCLTTSEPWVRAESCDPDKTAFPMRVVPILDVTFGPTVHIADVAMVRFSTGLHNALYLGASAGVVF